MKLNTGCNPVNTSQLKCKNKGCLHTTLFSAVFPPVIPQRQKRENVPVAVVVDVKCAGHALSDRVCRGPVLFLKIGEQPGDAVLHFNGWFFRNSNQGVKCPCGMGEGAVAERDIHLMDVAPA